MPQLTYWIALARDDDPAAHVRGRTRKTVLDSLQTDYGITGWKLYFHRPQKVTLAYRDAFDLLQRCVTDGVSSWEPMVEDAEPRPDRFGWSAGDLTLTHPDGTQETV